MSNKSTKDGRNSPGLCPGRVRSQAYVLCFNTCLNTCFNMSFDICFNTVFSFNTGFSACFNLFQQPNQFFVHRFRTQSTFSAQIPISASAVARICFLFEKRAREAWSPGAPGPGDSYWFESWEVPFFETIFRPRFFTIFVPKTTPKASQNRWKTKSKNEPENGSRKVR